MKRAEENESNSSKKNFTTLPYDGYETTNLILGGGIPSKNQPKSLVNKYASLMKETKSSAMRKSGQSDPSYITNSPKKSSKKKSPSPLSKSKTSAQLNT
jgi:hypothetical protein